MDLVQAGGNSIVKNWLGHLVLQLVWTVTLWSPLKSSEFEAIPWLFWRIA
jgi:hypothetical protein